MITYNKNNNWTVYRLQQFINKFSMAVIEQCILPLSLLPDKSIWMRIECQCLGRYQVRLGREIGTDFSFFMLPIIIIRPLPLTVMLKIIKLVRFCIWLSKTRWAAWGCRCRWMNGDLGQRWRGIWWWWWTTPHRQSSWRGEGRLGDKTGSRCPNR